MKMDREFADGQEIADLVSSTGSSSTLAGHLSNPLPIASAILSISERELSESTLFFKRVTLAIVRTKEDL